MIHELKRTDGVILFAHECESFKTCLEAAIKAGANLSRANLSRANLSRANLSRANLSRANLSRANLSRAGLFRANLSGANLSGANLSGANLFGADLSRANLSRANLSGANLSDANLSDADLSRADLSGANLSGANLSGVENAARSLAQTSIVPSEGAFVAWKKLKNDIIAKVAIPETAQRVNAAGSRKCRASSVVTLAMYKNEKAYSGIGIGRHDEKTQYVIGQETVADSFDTSITVECSHGIHFFITREEAEAYE